MQLMVAGALLNQERDAVVLVRRDERRRWYPDLWDLPSGHVEAHETPTSALVREISEELGVVVGEPSGPPIVHLYDYAADGVPVVDLTVWAITDWVGEVRNNAPWEHSEVRWVSKAELEALDLAHPEYAYLIGKLL